MDPSESICIGVLWVKALTMRKDTEIVARTDRKPLAWYASVRDCLPMSLILSPFLPHNICAMSVLLLWVLGIVHTRIGQKRTDRRIRASQREEKRHVFTKSPSFCLLMHNISQYIKTCMSLQPQRYQVDNACSYSNINSAFGPGYLKLSSPRSSEAKTANVSSRVVRDRQNSVSSRTSNDANSPRPRNIPDCKDLLECSHFTDNPSLVILKSAS